MTRRTLSNILVSGLLLASGQPILGQAAKPATPPVATAQPLLRATFIAQMDAQFRKMDADKNGQLTRIEIEQFDRLDALSKAEAGNRNLFAQLDSDGNKSLSEAEFKKLIVTPPAPNASPMLSRMDGNRDQQISLVEHRIATLANFDLIDADRDGVVSPTEMKARGITPR